MGIDTKALDRLNDDLPPEMQGRIERAASLITKEKEAGGRVVVITGSGPNIHEGVTTLIAELVSHGIVDGVLTSSAVVAHEMAGALDRVKRVPGDPLGYSLQDERTFSQPRPGRYFLPRGGLFEITVMDKGAVDHISKDFPVDRDLMAKAAGLEGKTIIKAAGNMAYPMGPRTELVAEKLLPACSARGLSLEELAGKGCHPRTMLGACARKGVPLLVSVPQLVGGGNVGICVADSIPVRERCKRIAHLLSGAGVIVESALALAQEVHDGPYESYTGHGIWAPHIGHESYTLRGKSVIRMDLDPALDAVWHHEHGDGAGAIQAAINDGKPKTKLFKVPFRMEMSGFARLEGSVPVTCDIGVAWPLMARLVAESLGIDLSFMSYPQSTPQGESMRQEICDEVGFFTFDEVNIE